MGENDNNDVETPTGHARRPCTSGVVSDKDVIRSQIGDSANAVSNGTRWRAKKLTRLPRGRSGVLSRGEF